MVRLHVKRGDESQFLMDTTVSVKSDELIQEVLDIYNGRLKIERVCYEVEELAKHGTFLPPNMLGLTDEQVEELKLVDEWADICVPSGGFEINRDPMGRRNGHQPLEKMGEILLRTVGEAKAAISKKIVDANLCLTPKVIKEQLDILRGACTIVYPMNLPPHEPIRLEFENKEQLGGTHDSLKVISSEEIELWFCGKQIHPGKLLSDFVGKNDKTKVIIKIQKRGQGAPAREPVMTEEEKKMMMMHAYKRQEDAKSGDDSSERVE